MADISARAACISELKAGLMEGFELAKTCPDKSHPRFAEHVARLERLHEIIVRYEGMTDAEWEATRDRQKMIAERDQDSNG